MLKHHSVWLLALTAIGLPVIAMADLKSDLVGLEKAMWTAWGKTDRVTYGKYLAPDYRSIVAPQNAVVGKEANLKALNAGKCELRSVSFEDVTVQDLGGGVALLGYTANQDIVCGGQPGAKKLAVTAVWRKVGDTWLTHSYQESPIK